MSGRRNLPDGLREVLFEFVPAGASVKVCAIDPVSGTEVSIVGPASASQADLERTAMAKLKYVLDKKRNNAGR